MKSLFLLAAILSLVFVAPAGQAEGCVDGCSSIPLSIGDFVTLGPPNSGSCTACGKCVHVCPTGALSEKGRSVAEMHKQRQFLPYLTIMREEDQ